MYVTGQIYFQIREPRSCRVGTYLRVGAIIFQHFQQVRTFLENKKKTRDNKVILLEPDKTKCNLSEHVQNIISNCQPRKLIFK